MSYTAIAAALALDDVSTPERLVAFALASYANREQQAFPGKAAAAARAGLSPRRYLAARDALVRREMIAVDGRHLGRGRSRTVSLVFACTEERIDRPINPALFEAVLSHSCATGPARLLLAALAALADEDRKVRDITTGELRAACGLSDGSYRRARATLLDAGELTVAGDGGGRGKTNCWQLHDPRVVRVDERPVARVRVPPPARAQPLLVSLSPVAQTSQENEAHGAIVGASD